MPHNALKSLPGRAIACSIKLLWHSRVSVNEKTTWEDPFHGRGIWLIPHSILACYLKMVF